MAHTDVWLYAHVVFGTKYGRQVITPEFEQRLWAYMGGIARQNRAHAIEIGGIEDHVHLVLRISADRSLAELVREIKSGSSLWVHQNHSAHFGWQTGYGGFSLSRSALDKVIAYVKNQRMHHRKMTFAEEWAALAKANRLEDENALAANA